MEEQQSTFTETAPQSGNSTVNAQPEPTATGEPHDSTVITGGADQQAATVQTPPAAPAGEQGNTAETAETAGIRQQPTQADIAGQQQPPPRQPVQPGSAYQLPPGYAVDPATGQVVFTGSVTQQPVQPGYVQPGVVYMQPQQPTPEQIAAQQAAMQQRYGQVINTVEKFVEGEATVADVVKTLYANTTQDDQLWKGVIVGAAATVLLTSEPVRKVMGKTLGGVFPGLKKGRPSPPETATETSAKSKMEKE